MYANVMPDFASFRPHFLPPLLAGGETPKRVSLPSLLGGSKCIFLRAATHPLNFPRKPLILKGIQVGRIVGHLLRAKTAKSFRINGLAGGSHRLTHLTHP